MKWYWIVLIVVAVALIGYFVAKSMKKSKSSVASSPAATPLTVVQGGANNALAPAAIAQPTATAAA